jgi:uncharacterized protein
MKSAILFHSKNGRSHCIDGVAAAWIAWNYLKWHKKHECIDVIPCMYGTKPPDMTEYEEIHVVDFSFPSAIVNQWISQCKIVTIIDHHKTAIEQLNKGLLFSIQGIRSEAKSGALLAFDHYYPDCEPHHFLRYVDDRDRWQFKLPFSKEIHRACFRLDEQEDWPFEAWAAHFNELACLVMSELIEDYVNEGADLLAQDELIIQNAAARAIPINVQGYRAGYVHLKDSEKSYYSEIGNVIAKLDFDFAVLDTGGSGWALRSANGFDTSRISKILGGGGHAPASGCKSDPSVRLSALVLTSLKSFWEWWQSRSPML